MAIENISPETGAALGEAGAEDQPILHDPEPLMARVERMLAERRSAAEQPGTRREAPPPELSNR